MLAVRVPAHFQAAQTVGSAGLSEDQCDRMIPASERFVAGVTVMPTDNRRKLASIDGFKKLAQDARCETHAPVIKGRVGWG